MKLLYSVLFVRVITKVKVYEVIVECIVCTLKVKVHEVIV